MLLYVHRWAGREVIIVCIAALFNHAVGIEVTISVQ